MKDSAYNLAALRELLNLGDSPQAVKRFLAKHADYLRGKNRHHPLCNFYVENVLLLRDRLRMVWEGSGYASRIVSELLFAKKLGGLVASEPSAEWKPVLVDWRGRRVNYVAEYPFQNDLWVLLKQAHLAKVCARPGCPAPYFIARRITQQYCLDDCAKAMQNEFRLRWWREHGSEWRRKRKKQSKRKGGKR